MYQFSLSIIIICFCLSPFLYLSIYMSNWISLSRLFFRFRDKFQKSYLFSLHHKRDGLECHKKVSNFTKIFQEKCCLCKLDTQKKIVCSVGWLVSVRATIWGKKLFQILLLVKVKESYTFKFRCPVGGPAKKGQRFEMCQS